MDTLSFGLLVDAALKGTLVLLAAGALTVILRRGSAARRHLVWQMAVLAILGLPLIKAFSPMQLAILPELRSPIVSAAPTVTPTAAPSVATPSSSRVEESSAATTSTRATPAVAAPFLVRALKWFGYAWLLVAAVLLMRLALGFVLVRWFALRADRKS